MKLYVVHQLVEVTSVYPMRTRPFKSPRFVCIGGMRAALVSIGVDTEYYEAWARSVRTAIKRDGVFRVWGNNDWQCSVGRWAISPCDLPAAYLKFLEYLPD